MALASFTHTHTTYLDTWSAPRPCRQAKELAEGQKNAEVKQLLIARPPPPANWNWRKGSDSSRNMHILTIGRSHLAEGGVGRTECNKNGRPAGAGDVEFRGCWGFPEAVAHW